MRRKAIAALLALTGTVFAANLDPNNPTGSRGLILIDKLGRHIRFFDPTTFKELSKFEVGVNPHDVAITADHKTAYATIYGDGVYGKNPNPGHTISIIDLEARKEIGVIDISPYIAPHGIQIDASGMLYVSCDLSRKMLVIDPKTRSIKAAVDTEGTGHWLAILPDASKAYVANKSDRLFITVIDLKTNKLVGRIPVPHGTQGIVASPDGKRVLVADTTEPQMFVIDTATDKVVDQVPLKGMSGGAYKMRYSPDGSQILACDLRSTVNVLKASDLHAEPQLFIVGKNPMGFAFSPDGKTVLVANHGDGTVSVIDLKASRVTSNFKAGTGIEVLSYY